MTIVKAVLFWAAVVTTAFVMLKLVRIAFGFALFLAVSLAIGIGTVLTSYVQGLNGKIIEASTSTNSIGGVR